METLDLCSLHLSFVIPSSKEPHGSSEQVVSLNQHLSMRGRLVNGFCSTKIEIETCKAESRFAAFLFVLGLARADFVRAQSVVSASAKGGRQVRAFLRATAVASIAELSAHTSSLKHKPNPFMIRGVLSSVQGATIRTQAFKGIL